MTYFFRLLDVDIGTKGNLLAQDIRSLNSVRSGQFSAVCDFQEFAVVPGSPAAYWVSSHVRSMFARYPSLEGENRSIRVGLQTGDDFRFVRTWWEVSAGQLNGAGQQGTELIIQRTFSGERWVPFAKGGDFSRFYADIHLIVDWLNNGEEIKTFSDENGRLLSRPQNTDYYFRSGITWSDRTTKLFSARAWPAGGIFSVKGSAGFFSENEYYMLALMNSLAFNGFLSLLVGAGDVAARSYQVGTIGLVPYASRPAANWRIELESLVASSIEQKRRLDAAVETSHIFTVPVIVPPISTSLGATIEAHLRRLHTIEKELAEQAAVIDDRVFRIYGFGINDEAVIRQTLKGAAFSIGGNDDATAGDEDMSERNEEVVAGDRYVSDMLSYMLGCVFGRWDARFACDVSLLPQMQGAFEPLPRCSPGMLVGPDGLPATPGNVVSEEWLRARLNVITLPLQDAIHQATIPDSEYPLRVDWDGIIPDDEAHSDDIVRRVREVLELLWGERADAIELEACELLDVSSLREYFRQPRYFFDFHIKRYSKSRRKAPIYWLLQSAKKNYGLWLYYHRMDQDTLFKALTLYAEPKLSLEKIRLEDLRGQLNPDLPARERRALEKSIARQEALIAELTDFRNELERIARLQLAPDFNDGVIISIAPLHSLVPWKEAGKMWDELVAGKYAWSAMSQRMRERGLVRA